MRQASWGDGGSRRCRFPPIPPGQLFPRQSSAPPAPGRAPRVGFVVSGKVMAKDVKAGRVKTVQGQDLTVTTNMGVMVDQSKVIATDVAASNGVIHAIDTVLMPK